MEIQELLEQVKAGNAFHRGSKTVFAKRAI